MIEAFMTVVNFFIGIVFVIAAAYFAYMSSHLVSEKKAGKRLPLFWEEDRTKPFDKSDIEYRDGDNT